jgi:hypothetical protein
MDYFKLPQTTKVQRVVPKNSFDSYANTKQRKLFTDKVSKITWTNKLSQKTINLETKEIKEIQVFRIELKVKDDISSILNIIDKAIPYHIIFIVAHEGLIYLSASMKHPHPANEDNSVIDWTFKSKWFEASKDLFRINLKSNLDFVFEDFCNQISGLRLTNKLPLHLLVERSKQIESLQKEIRNLEAQISKAIQFNQKVHWNVELRSKRSELKKLLSVGS